MEVDLAEERRKSRERRAGDDVVLDATPRERILGADRVKAAEPYVRELRRKHVGSDEPLEEPALEDRPPRVRGLDRAFDAAVRRLAEATGFREADVYDWIVYGTRPQLHRTILRWGDREERLPDGTRLAHRSVTLTFNAPVTQKELVRVYRERIRELWEPPEDPGADELAIVGPDVSDLDHHLLELVKRMPDATWPERLEEWRTSPMPGRSSDEWKREQGNVTVEALRIRWHRIDEDTRKRFTTTTED